MSTQRSGRLFGASAVLVTGMLACGTALAQLGPPPLRQLIDQNGVDLMSGQFSLVKTDIDIGPAESRLDYTRSAASSSGGFTNGTGGSSVDIRLIFEDSANVSVQVGTAKEKFTVSGSTYTVSNGMGSTLVFDTPSNNFIYTQRDGTEIRFPARPPNAYDLQALSVREPDGLLTEYTTTQANFSTQIRSVVNNAGYQLKFQYGTSSFDVYALNRTVAYCDPAADTCSATAGAPHATIASSQVPPPPNANYYTSSSYAVTSTDAGGRQTRWTYAADALSYGIAFGPSAVKSPSAGSDDTTTSFEISGPPLFYQYASVSSVTRRGQTWTYHLSEDTGWPTFIVTDPLGNHRDVTVDLEHSRLLSDKDERGGVTSFQYDSLGRRTRITYPEGNYVQLTYDSRGNITERRQVAKPGSGLPDLVESATFPANCPNPKTCNQPTTTTNTRGQITNYEYDSTHGGVTSIKRPAPYSGGVRPETRYGYTALYAWYRNSAGALVQSTTPIYKLTSVSACRTLASCANTADEMRTTYGYQEGSASAGSNLLLTSVTQSAGDGSVSTTTTLSYDDRGNQIGVDGPAAGSADSAITRYDVLRRVVGTIGPDPDGAGPLKRRAMRFTYNADDQITSIERGTVNGTTDSDWAAFVMLERINVGFDSAGRRSYVARIGGGSPMALTQFSYDAAGRPECTAQRMNPATFASPPASACTLATSGAYGPDMITKTSYDAAGNITRIQHGYGTSLVRDASRSTYTVNGRVSTLTDARNNVTTYEYDGFDRQYKTRFPSSTGASSTTDYEQLGFNSVGDITSRRLRDGQSIGFVYDLLGRLTTRNLPGGEAAVTYGYDNIGRTTSVTQSSSSVSFGYDGLGRMTTQTGPQGTLTTSYDGAGHRKRLTWPDNFYVDYDYLVTGEMSAIRENGATSGIGVLVTYGYDDLGRRVSLTRGNGTVTQYQYENGSRLQQLTQNLAATAADQTVGLSYNPVSQIVSRTSSNDVYSWTENQNTSISYGVNSLNQYTTVAGATQTYDARGNLTSAGAGTFGYTSENMLISAPGSVSLAYDPMGRLSQVGGSSTTRFQYDGDDLVAEYNASNQLLRRYVKGASENETVVWYEGSGTATRRWLHEDERGSIVAISNASGGQFAINRYDESGKPGATNTGRFQFTGQMWIAEVGLYYARARFYSPVLGRFMQTDPVGYAAGMNLYAYASGDPINMLDPSGLDDVATVTVTGSRDSDCGWDCIGYPGYMPDPNLRPEVLELMAKQLEAQLQSIFLDQTIDEIVIRGKRAHKLGGVRINMRLKAPEEQMWAVLQDFTVVNLPMIGVDTTDVCGNPVTANKVDMSKVQLPAGAKIVALIHTHPDDRDPFPEGGDYDTANDYTDTKGVFHQGRPLYGITRDGVWALRHNTPRGTPPDALEGPTPTRRGGGAPCTMRRK